MCTVNLPYALIWPNGRNTYSTRKINSSSTASHGNSLKDNMNLSILQTITMTHHAPWDVHTSLVKFTYNANRSFPLKIGTGTEQTKSQDLRRHGATRTRSSHLKYLLKTLLVSLAILFISCLFDDMIVSCITRCVTGPLIQTITKWLETIHPIASSQKSMMVIAEL